MKAQFQSRCPPCNGTIQRGDSITKTGEGWICEYCLPGSQTERSTTRGQLVTEDIEPIKPDEVRCERCFTYHRGEC